jgi:rRNA maturation RNase YbeY
MSALIQFFTEEVDFSAEHEPLLRDWISNAIHQEELAAGVINIIFCNDEYLSELNQRFLERDTLTDVIAFDYSEGEREVSGDIFISVDRTRDNAAKYGQTFEGETRRVIIHGLLHLCGYHDKTAEEKAQMTAKEDYYLSLLPF